MPGNADLKLLVPRDATAGWAMGVARSRWHNTVDASEGFFMFCDNRMCSALTRVQNLDTKIPQEVTFDVRKESTFGYQAQPCVPAATRPQRVAPAVSATSAAASSSPHPMALLWTCC